MSFVYTNTTTFNLESVLRANILGSDYYNKTCLEMSTWEEVIDEIYECVEDVEPWMSGNARGPSTAFCLLHRLFTLKLNTKQVKDTINHRDSPYIRAIGLLFLRYVGDPKTLLSWVGPFLADKEFSPFRVLETQPEPRRLTVHPAPQALPCCKQCHKCTTVSLLA